MPIRSSPQRRGRRTLSGRDQLQKLVDQHGIGPVTGWLTDIKASRRTKRPRRAPHGARIDDIPLLKEAAVHWCRRPDKSVLSVWPVLLEIGGSESTARRLLRRLRDTDLAAGDELVELGLGELFAAARLLRMARSSGRSGRGAARAAGAFLRLRYPGAAADKRLARDLEVSPDVAELLLRGRDWTSTHFEKATQTWPGFRTFVFPPTSDQLTQRLERLAIGFERLGDQIAQLRRELRSY